MESEISDWQLCSCVTGGPCLRRGAQFKHIVEVVWAGQSDDRSRDVLASPVELDGWVARGEITVAWCKTCEGTADSCPAFRPFVVAAGNREDPDLAVLRSFIRAVRGKDGVMGLADVVAGLSNVMHERRPDLLQQRARFGRPQLEAALRTVIHDDDLAAVVVEYWLRVLHRLLRWAGAYAD